MRRPLDRSPQRRRTASCDYPARQAMLVAANGGLNADGAHANILGLVDPSEYPLVTVHPLVGAPVGREKIGFVTAPNGKKFECSHHAVVLPIAECAFLDYVLDYGNEARREGVARHFFKQMVAGTWRLHQLGIAHLDLKLENMLLSAESSDATLMISDFGLSEKVGSTGWCDYQITACSASYAPPEVYFPNVFAANHDNTNAFAVDVWTLGVCLATMVTGIEIFNAEHLTKRKHVVFAEMRDAQKSGANGLLKACSASKYSAVALGKFNWPGEPPRRETPGLAEVAARPHAACGPGDPSYARPGRRRSVAQRDHGAYAAGRRPATPLVGGGAAGGRRPATPLVGGDRSGVQVVGCGRRGGGAAVQRLQRCADGRPQRGVPGPVCPRE